MLWREMISKSSDFLARKGIDDGAVCTEELAACLLCTPRSSLFAHLDSEASQKHVDAMRRGVARLAQGEPIQYIIKNWDFRSLRLKCDKRALIPRPETEGLVGLVLEHLRSGFPQDGAARPSVIDVGTGTGAIILSIAKEFAAPALLVGTDVSEDAVALAKENAAALGLDGKVKFAVMDGLDEFEEPALFDVIVSNPPYIESDVIATLAPRVRDYEPRIALDGGATGLDFYERYLSDALNLLKPRGAVFFEIGENQGPAVERMMREYGFAGVQIRNDLAGRNRYASGMLDS